MNDYIRGTFGIISIEDKVAENRIRWLGLTK